MYTSNYLPQADSDPTSDLGTGFSGLDAMGKRDAIEKDKGLDRPELTKYMQDSLEVVYIYAVCQFIYSKNTSSCVPVLDQRKLAKISAIDGEQIWETSGIDPGLEKVICGLRYCSVP